MARSMRGVSRRTGARDEPAWKAARAAVLQEFPTLSERAAGEQASDAICYASLYYPQWLWSGLTPKRPS